jgi:hypothetical protein
MDRRQVSGNIKRTVEKEKTQVQKDEYGKTKKDDEGCVMWIQRKCI